MGLKRFALGLNFLPKGVLYCGTASDLTDRKLWEGLVAKEFLAEAAGS